jgi:hypothetical protein
MKLSGYYLFMSIDVQSFVEKYPKIKYYRPPNLEMDLMSNIVINVINTNAFTCCMM